MEPMAPLADLALSRRLERTEGRASADLVEAKARVFPDSGSCWQDFAGAIALHDGPTSPITQTFGLGMFQPVTAADLDAIEAFFKQRGSPVYHEVSPLADPTALALLTARGYQPFEFTSMLYRPLTPDVRLSGPRNDKLRVRLVRDDEHDLWGETAARGWEATGELGELLRGLGRVNAARAEPLSFLAELDGNPVAAGSLFLHDGAALLAGASTVPEARRQGAQLALLEARLRFAAGRGCDLAMMGAAPGSGSQRNAERHGFRIAYTRVKWRR
jgi:GNAT superfamily N-acetyltransferase